MTKKEVAKYDFLSPTAPEGYAEGKGQEDITTADIIVPRIKLAQALTPEVLDKRAEEGDLIHNITGEVICKAGHKLPFIPIMYTKEFIIWREREGGGGIIARATRKKVGNQLKYAWDVPNVTHKDKIGGKIEVSYDLKTYTTDVLALADDETDTLACWGQPDASGDSVPPVAQMTHNYLVVLPTLGMELIAISLSRTSAKKGAQLNTMLRMGPADLYTRVFEAATYIDHSDQYKFANWIFSPAGFVSQDQSEMLANLKKLHEDFKRTSFKVEIDAAEDQEAEEEGF
jgi:hypothetical protein